MSAKSGGRAPISSRPLVDRARSYQKLIARRTWSPSTPTLRVLIVGTLVMLMGMVGHSVWVADDLVSYADRPNEYASLVALVTARCETGSCGVRYRDIRSQPPELSRLMHRLRVQEITHDAALGRTRLRGGYGADFSLQYLSPPTPHQVRWRAVEADRGASGSRGRPPITHDLGGGWTQIERR